VVRRGSYDAKSNTIPLELEATAGPLVRIVVTGAKFSGGELKKLVPVYQEGTVDTDLLEEGKRNIRERLERNGYFDAGVEYVTRTQEVTLNGGTQGKRRVDHLSRGARGPAHTDGNRVRWQSLFQYGIAAQSPDDLPERIPDAGKIQSKIDGVRPGLD